MIGIVCGGGGYPQLIINACKKKKLNFCLLFLGNQIKNQEDLKVPKISVKLGEISKTLNFLKSNKVNKLVFAGHIKRPNIFDLSLDMMGLKWLIKIWKNLVFRGDDSLLRMVSGLFEENSIQVISGTDLLDNVFFDEGIFSKRIPDKKEQEEINLGIREAQSLGIQDIGQSVIVSGDKIIAKEDSSGTDAMIDRCYEGILVKTTKPQQDDRLDLPTIGVQTIENLHQHGLKGLVIEAGRTIVVDKEEVIKKVNEYGLFLQAVKLKKKIKVFIISGEASGDYLGGRLMKDMKKINDDIEFVGIGGQCMDQAGLINLCPISKLSLIGIWEVIGKIFCIRKLIKETVEVIGYYKPDVLITIDSSGFTHRIDKLVKKNGYEIPIVHYVAPPVWAWRKWRARSLHKFIDKLMVLFPFEVDIFQENNLNTVFVGHPVAVDEDIAINEEIVEEKSSRDPVITLLPGSRPSELEKHMPVLKKFTELISIKYPKVQFYLPTVKEVAPLIKKYVENWKIKPTVSTKKMKKVKAYSLSNVAVAASGTVTLELAKMELPFVVIYKTSWPTYHLVKWLIKVPYVCLVNILAQKPVVTELLQDDCTAENICNAVENLINSKENDQLKSEFRKVIKQIKIPRSKAAEEVLEFIERK